MKRLSIPLNPELHRRLKILAALKETSIAEIVRAALSGAMEPAAMNQRPGNHLPPTAPLETR